MKRGSFLETGLSSPAAKYLERLKRFQIDDSTLWQRADAGWEDKEAYLRVLKKVERRPEMVSLASAVIHLADQGPLGPASLGAAQAAAQKSFPFGRGLPVIEEEKERGIDGLTLLMDC